jgi:pimeloyl-ACP methyl ester carboxylesterase
VSAKAAKAERRVRRTYVEGLHGQVHLWLAGPEDPTAIPIMCFHASPLSGRVFEFLLDELSEDRWVFAPDTPGYGLSDPPDEPISITGYATAMAHLLDRLKIEQVDLVGYATGSFIGAELARQRPNLVRRLVLLGAPILEKVDSEDLEEKFGHEIEPQADGSHLIPLWEQIYDGRGPLQTLDWLMYVYPDHIQAGPRKPWAPNAAFQCDLKGILQQLDQPILVLNFSGQIYETTARCQPYLKNGHLVDKPEWGHGFLQTQPKEMAKLVRDFFDN